LDRTVALSTLAQNTTVNPAAAQASPLLVANRIAKNYGDEGERLTAVIDDVSFSMARGEIISIVGPSGCGKTTLLNLLCGLISLSRGTVSWRGQALRGMPDRVGYMLQKDLLLPWRTVLRNVTLGLELKPGTRSERDERAHSILEKVGLAPFHAYYPSRLSGGMRQRVALARTLVTDPEVLLLDEPFAALDFQTKLVLESDMAKLVRGEGRSLLMITHDVEEAVSLSDRVIVLSHRPSRVKATHRIELGTDRTDMIAARESPMFMDYVRTIWSELEVRAADSMTTAAV
jgi:NitT/TauT family transport system ATP-binding protein